MCVFYSSTLKIDNMSRFQRFEMIRRTLINKVIRTIPAVDVASGAYWICLNNCSRHRLYWVAHNCVYINILLFIFSRSSVLSLTFRWKLRLPLVEHRQAAIKFSFMSLPLSHRPTNLLNVRLRLLTSSMIDFFFFLKRINVYWMFGLWILKVK